jgi:DNA-binding HxlR family transcriptional regulator
MLQKHILGISNKMFTQTVRELEKDGLITRKVFPVVPPRVEYELSARGKSLENILKNLDEWGSKDIQEEI